MNNRLVSNMANVEAYVNQTLYLFFNCYTLFVSNETFDENLIMMCIGVGINYYEEAKAGAISEYMLYDIINISQHQN